ncbi:LCP family protein [Streptomyces sodiiphilus]|uniref:LCP family protein n=1 Tax=Streptomyces sodiiphilus TaxID=226217 RepID=A0ABN2NS26_9ACTN
MADDIPHADAGRAGDASAGPGRPGPAPRQNPGRRRVLRIAALTLAAAILLGGAGAAAVYLKLDGNISGIDIDAVLGTDRPEDRPDGSLDILVLGSDARPEGDGEGSDGEARADAAMIVHINEGHESATVVSLPRDTLIARPECVLEDGSTVPAERRAMFNEAYAVGGPACAVKTVESMTGIRMDHYLEIDFKGFEKIIDTLGGVEVTVTEPLEDEKSRLSLEPGTHRLDGGQALALVRTRKSVGDGSDLGRINLQHDFLRALAAEVREVGLFTSPKKLYHLADTATSAITTDSAIASVGDLSSLGRTLQGIGPEDLQTVTLPVVYDEEDPNRVVPIEDQAEQVWEALRRDLPVPDSAMKDSAAGESEGNGLVR